MKLKQIPEDFRVTELCDVTPGREGSFAFYKLTKRNIGTPEAIREICQRWKLTPRQVSYGGLKDRHAITEQYLSIQHGQRDNLKAKAWQLHYLGQISQPYHSTDFHGNEFAVVLRDLNKREISRIKLQLEQAVSAGVPNYYDEQRFRSMGRGKAFIARHLIAGDFEAALRLAIAEPYAYDRKDEKEQKRILQAHWGDWSWLLIQFKHGPTRRVIQHLNHAPTDFRGAFTRLPHELQSLYLSAYQSHLWNRILGKWLLDCIKNDHRLAIHLNGEALPMPKKWPPEADIPHTMALPLPSARLHLDAQDPMLPYYEQVMREEGLSMADMKIKDLREPFFSKGARHVLFFPKSLTWTKEADELHPGQRKLSLRFQLPRGSYATMFIKRITEAKPHRFIVNAARPSTLSD